MKTKLAPIPKFVGVPSEAYAAGRNEMEAGLDGLATVQFLRRHEHVASTTGVVSEVSKLTLNPRLVYRSIVLFVGTEVSAAGKFYLAGDITLSRGGKEITRLPADSSILTAGTVVIPAEPGALPGFAQNFWPFQTTPAAGTVELKLDDATAPVSYFVAPLQIVCAADEISYNARGFVGAGISLIHVSALLQITSSDASF